MDILKIRKKKREEEERQGREAPPASSSSGTSSEGLTTPPSASTPESAPSAAAPAPPPHVSASASAPAPPPASEPAPASSSASSSAPAASPPAESPPPPPAPRAPATPRSSKGTEAKAPLEADDPLHEFLARYDEGAEELGLAAAPEAVRDESKRYLAFQLAGEEYAVSIMEIREILRVLALTPVPRAPREILGVLSKRGLVLPVIDLAASLGLREPDRGWTPRQRILVVGDGDRVCGLRVDQVLEVIRLGARDVEEVPASLGARSRHQLRGLGRVGERMFILLDVPAVLHALAVGAGLESREEVA